ncbi:MAG: leucine-rich repeat protein [Oscillospiraceae bacterium]|nr:leucine-rich repeat protein [Oscillospiraceae bacterium]
MKKVFAFAMSVLIVFALCSCGITTSASENKDADSNQSGNISSNKNQTLEDKTTSEDAKDCSHLWSQWEEKTKATCQIAGIKERVCQNCNATESETVKATDHTESDWIVEKEAKVGQDGLKYKKCTHCGKRMQEETLPALKEDHRHAVAQWVVTKSPDCTNNGSQNGICACGQVLETKVISKLGHSPVTDKSVAATCTASGLTDGSHCSVCSTVLTAQEVVTAQGHSLSFKTVAANGGKEAHKLYSCANCTYSYEEVIDSTAVLKFLSNNDGTCRVTGTTDKTVTTLIIPEKSPAGDTVVAIGGEAFKNCDALEAVVLPDTVVKIFYDAFYSCDKLKTVVFPKNGAQNLELNYQCFAFCGFEELDLTNVTMETVGQHAFYGCKSLKTVKLGAVTTIDNFAFAECSELVSLIHAGNLVTIGERSFDGCKKLTELRGKNSQHNLDTVLQFSYHSFYGSGIRDIVFNKNLKGTNNAFEGCKNLGTVDFSQVSSKFASFFGSKIEKLIFPSSLSRIPDNCFRNATIDSLVLPSSVTEIGNGAFAEARIGKLTFGSGLTRIGANAFNGTQATYDFSRVTRPLTIDYEAFANNDFTSFAFPESTVFIGAGALMGCNKLQILSIPFIGEDAEAGNASTHCFAWLFGRDVNCWDQTSVVPTTLKTVILHGENPDVRAFMGVKITALVVGKDITAIGNENFNSSSSLTRVYYEGTQQEWNAITKGTYDNQKLSSADKYFYSETQPPTEGNFWHYDANGAITLW